MIYKVDGCVKCGKLIAAEYSKRGYKQLLCGKCFLQFIREKQLANATGEALKELEKAGRY